MNPSSILPHGLRAAILTVGSELTTGRIADTNAQWIAAELTRRGIDVAWIATVDDVPEAIRDAWEACRARGALVWVTGGLGPTADDLTVETLAAALGRELREDPGAVERMRAAYARRGAELTAYARRMARIPAGAEALPNPVGAAPGIWLEDAGTTAVVLPGVPAEMKAIARDSVLPRLAGRGRPVAARDFRITGLHEGGVDERVRDLWRALGPEDRFALQLDRGEVVLRVVLGGPDAATRLDGLDRELRARLGPAIYGTDAERLESVLVARLAGRGATVAVAESVTGGLVTARLAAVPGASRVLAGGWVVYRDAAKADWLGLPAARLATDGAVSAATAEALAAAARARSGAAFAVATTGWAGPEGGTAADPVGTVYLGVATEAGAAAERRWFRGDRDQVRELAATAALDLLLRKLE